MLYTVKEDLILLRELKLTVKQLMFIKMLVRDPSLDQASWRKLSYAMSLEFQKTNPLDKDELLDLIKREIIIDLNDTTGIIYYDCFEINPKYQRRFVLKVTGMPTELFDAYPYEINTGTFRFWGKDISAEELAKSYLQAIDKNEAQHAMIMEDLEWAKANNALLVGLKKFVDSKYWFYIRDLKKRTTPNTINDVTIG